MNYCQAGNTVDGPDTGTSANGMGDAGARGQLQFGVSGQTIPAAAAAADDDDAGGDTSETIRKQSR